MEFQNGLQFAAIPPRAAWLPYPAKLAPSFAATDNPATCIVVEDSERGLAQRIGPA